MIKKWRQAALAGAIIALSGCFGGYSPNSTFYTLSTPMEVQALSQKTFDIQIEKIELADYLQQPQIVTIDSNRVEIVKSEFNRWGAPLSDIIQRTLAADIAQYLPQAQIRTVDSIYKPAAYNINVEISRFEGTWDEQVMIEAWWEISGKDGSILAARRSFFKTDLGKGYVDLVEKQSELVDKLAKEIAEAVIKRK